MSFTLAGKRALVTGASRGIGREVALTLARAGADVAVHYARAGDEAASVAKEIEALGRRAVTIKADLSEPRSGKALIREAVASLGPLDVLVNNAGENRPASFLDLKIEDVEHQMRLNYASALVATQAFARACRTPGARVVNVGSIAGEIARPGSAAYGASKAALHSLTKSAAEALAPGISVNAVAPGMVDTGTHPEMMTPEFVARVSSQVPMRRFATSAEIAECVLFFAAGPAYVTGQVLVVDGGIGNVYFR